MASLDRASTAEHDAPDVVWRRERAVKRTVVVVALVAAVSAAIIATAGAGSDRPMVLKDSGSASASGTLPVLETTDVAAGEGTHIGRYTMTAGEEVNFATGAITGGHFTLTAANGDTITGTYSGAAEPGLTGYLVSGPITGGTGRFAGATGFLTWHGTVDAAFNFTDEVEGTISY
jgi:hypothetical protein